MKLVPVQLEQQLDIEFSLVEEFDDDSQEHEEGMMPRVLIMHVRGTYRTGSYGNPDADALVLALHGMLRMLSPDALVFDFRELDYTWGNRMAEVLRCDNEERWLPIVRSYCVSDRCRPALASLGLDAEVLLDDLGDAAAVARDEAMLLRALDEMNSRSLEMIVLVREGTLPKVLHPALVSAESRLRDHFSQSWALRSWAVDSRAVAVLWVSADEFEQAREFPEYVALDPAGESVLAFAPRPDWPEWFNEIRHRTVS
ncbi:hypothetical protein ACNOYE_19050 [Nannocystaceae bacterium ST9]